MAATGLTGDSVGKVSTCNTGDTGDAGPISELRRSLEGGNGNPLQYSCLGNPMDREAWQAAVCEVAESQTQMSTWRIHICWPFNISHSASGPSVFSLKHHLSGAHRPPPLCGFLLSVTPSIVVPLKTSLQCWIGCTSQEKTSTPLFTDFAASFHHPIQPST